MHIGYTHRKAEIGDESEEKRSLTIRLPLKVITLLTVSLVHLRSDQSPLRQRLAKPNPYWYCQVICRCLYAEKLQITY
jgi:transcriptional regulator of met regulon